MSAKIKEQIRSGWPIMQMSYLVNVKIGNIKEIFLPKTGMREKQLLQDPGYVKGVETTCCMVSCKVLQNILCQRSQKK